jgi:predicted metal-binding membrane protein
VLRSGLEPTIAVLARRDRILIASCIAVITLLAWAYLVYLEREMAAMMEHERMMAAMGMAMDMSWKPADVLFNFAMWVVMMVGMMAPAATPMLLLFAASRAGREKRAVSPATLAFGSGYLVVWSAFSAGATLAQWGLHQAALLSGAEMASSSRLLSGAILVAVGAYQLTPWKNRCLTHCRSPLGFLMTNWRDGTMGSFSMGVRHGAFCLGCCWALMCVLFVVGVMNLLWVAVLTIFVLLEKIGPAGWLVARAAGVSLIVAGVVVMMR